MEKDKSNSEAKIQKNQPVFEDLLAPGNNSKPNTAVESKTIEKRSDDLYSVHNFELDINIPVSINGNYFILIKNIF